MLSYVDTGALVALAARSDKNHRAALNYAREAARSGTRFILGRPVLVEYLDGVTKRVGKRRAIEQLRHLEASTIMRVEPDTEDDHARARELFLRYDDKPIDFTDCLSFAIMERLGLSEAFGFDRDFEVHGFARVP